MRDLIVLQDRAITPVIGSPDFDETFTENSTVYALIETKKGDTAFDGIDTEVDVTHWFYIRFISGITSGTWINYQGDRYDILDVEDLDTRNEFMLLRATDRGTDTKRASQA